MALMLCMPLLCFIHSFSAVTQLQWLCRFCLLRPILPLYGYTSAFMNRASTSFPWPSWVWSHHCTDSMDMLISAMLYSSGPAQDALMVGEPFYLLRSHSGTDDVGLPLPKLPISFPLNESPDGIRLLLFTLFTFCTQLQDCTEGTVTLLFGPLMCPVCARYSNDGGRIPTCSFRSAVLLHHGTDVASLTLFTSPSQAQPRYNTALVLWACYFLSCPHPSQCNHCADGAVFLLFPPFT